MVRSRSRSPWKGVRLGLAVPVAVLAAILQTGSGSEMAGELAAPATGLEGAAVGSGARRVLDALLRRHRRLAAAPVPLASRKADAAALTLEAGLPPPPPAVVPPAVWRQTAMLPEKLEAAGLGAVPPVLPVAARVGAQEAEREPRPTADDPSPEPAAGPTPRRDPLDLPLREEDKWREWLLTVELNGNRVSEGAYLIEDPESGRLAAPVEELRRWRIRIERDRILTFQGMPFYPLDAIPGARFTFDRSALRLVLTVPPAQFQPFSLERKAPPKPMPQAAAGAFLDYDFLYALGEDVEDRVDGLAELGVFGDLGVVLGSLRFDDILGGRDVTRLETSFVKDMPTERKSIRAGDSLTGGGAMARPVRFGGIQYATNFATDPSFVTFPLPSIGGLAEQPSVVEVLIDNVRRSTGEVPAGPFRIPNVPVVTGAGEIQLKVTDLLGREKLITQSYYVSSRLLRAGLHDFSYEAGFLRRDFGRDSFDYGDPMAAATHRYGFSDSFTGEAHAELEPGRQSLAVGGTFRLGTFGTVTAGAGVSHDDGEGTGFLGQLSYEYLGRGFSISARSRYTDSAFRQFGDVGGVRRTDQLGLGLQLGDYGHLGLLLVNQERVDLEDALTVNGNYSLRLGPGSLIVNLARLFEPDEELAVTVSYSLPLSGNRSVSSRLEASDRRTRGRAQFRQARGATDLGLDYRLAAELGDDPRYIDARAGYQGRLGAVTGDFELTDGNANGRLGVSGSVAFIDGRLALTRRIGRAFGLVQLPGFANVRVYLDNREVGRTDEEGMLLIPGLRPYEVNRLRVELDDLPLGAVVTRGEVETVPYDRAGILIPFEVRLAARALVRLVGPLGEPLPAGLELADRERTVVALVGRDGLAEVTGRPEGATGEIFGRAGEILYRCTIPAYDAADLLADLGERRCARD